MVRGIFRVNIYYKDDKEVCTETSSHWMLKRITLF